MWNKSAAAQLDSHLRERRKTFTRRIEAIDRIQGAANTLDERIAEIDAQDRHLTALDAKLMELTSHLVESPALLDIPPTVAWEPTLPQVQAA
jgi:uncharacterized coiled-coil protein SlyX